MAKVHTIDTREVGKIEIHISIKTGFFDVHIVDDEKRTKVEVIHKFGVVKTYDEALNQIEDIKKIFLSNYLLKRKVIILTVKTSASDRKVDNVWLGKVIGQKAMDDKLESGSGFVIQWYVADEYALEFETNLSKYNTTIYKVTESCSNSKRDWTDSKPNTLHQLGIYGGGEKRVIA